MLYTHVGRDGEYAPLLQVEVARCYHGPREGALLCGVVKQARIPDLAASGLVMLGSTACIRGLMDDLCVRYPMRMSNHACVPC